jgi:WD40 repeat protein
LHTGEYLKTFKDCHTDEVTSVGIYLSQNFNTPPLIITGGLDCKVVMWDLKTCIPLRIIDVHQEVEYIAVSCSSSSDTPQVVVVTSDDAAVLWDLAHGIYDLELYISYIQY